VYLAFHRTRVFIQPKLGFVILATFAIIMSSITWLHTTDWSNNVDFALSEQRNHPNSARANQVLGATYLFLAERNPEREAEFFALARQHFLAEVQHSEIRQSSLFALISAESCAGKPRDPELYSLLETRLREQPFHAASTGWLQAMIIQNSKVRCDIPKEDVERFIRASYDNPRKQPITAAKLYSIASAFYANEYGDFDSAVYLLALAIDVLPAETTYRIYMARLLAHVGRNDDARLELSHASQLDRLGLYTDQIEEVLQSLD
jgi:hypothetical protein